MNSLVRLRFIRACLTLRAPTAIALTLLQRTPVLRLLVASDEMVAASSIGALVRSAIAASVSVGAMHSLAGATALVASQPGPVHVTAGKSIAPIAFTVSNTINIASWMIGGILPPGLTLDAAEGGASLAGPGVLDATTDSAPVDDPYGYGGGSGVMSTTPVLQGTPTQAGTFTFTLQAYELSALTGLQSDTFSFTVSVDPTAGANVAPAFTAQPAAQSANVGAAVTFAATASGTPAPSYQWFRNGTAISGATSATLALTNVQATDAGTYTVTATNTAGNATSSAVALSVNNPVGTGVAPAIATQPSAQTVATGSTAVFSVAASGTPVPTYQWSKNGVAVANATSPTLVIAGAKASDAGDYSVAVTNASGKVTSTTANLALSNDANFGHLLNLSVLTTISAAVPNFSVGTVIGGAGTSGNRAILARAVGPSLAAFGVAGTIADPTIVMQSDGGTVATNDNWGGGATISGAAAQVGAFPFVNATSTDAAVFPTVPGAGYTLLISGVGGATGSVLAELYDAGATFSASTPRLINLSVRKQLDANEVLTAGFVIGGNTSRTVLVRAIGPGLAAFGLGGTMADPKVQLYADSTLLASNDNWGGDPQLNAVCSAVGAFAIADGASKDAMLVITLPPGSYSAQASGATAGTALVEVYEVP